MTFLTASHRAQQPDYLQMTVSCIVTSRQRKMHLYCSRTQTNYSNGRVTRKWSSTPRSARLSMSPTKGSSSSKLTQFTTTLWKNSPPQNILGLTFTKTLSWNNHINGINKANSIRAFLQRNMHQCPRKTQELCYKTLVRPIVEYSSIIWDPQTASYTHKLEMVQRRYARFVLGDYRTTSSVTAMISQLQWTTLQERRAQAKAVMMYKIVNNLVDVPHTFLAPCTVSLRGHSYKYMIPFTRTGVYTQSFFPNSIRIWNNLPVDLINCTTLASFKQGVQSVQLR